MVADANHGVRISRTQDSQWVESASYENWELISMTFADRVTMLGSSSS